MKTNQTAIKTIAPRHRGAVRLPDRARGAAMLVIVLVVVAVALVAWGLFSRGSASAKLKEQTEASAVLPVQVIAPGKAGGDVDLTLPGNVQANYESPIYARTPGYLKRWLVDIGSPVKAGQVLAEIEAPDLDQQLRAAEANVANAQAGQQIARISAERWKDLRSTDSVSQQDADERLSQYQVSEAATQSAQANLQRLRELIGFKKIVAPFDGVITARNTDIGALINAGSSSGNELFRIADMKSLRLYVRVPQNYAAATQAGVAADVHFPDRPGMTYQAKISSTASAIDDASRTMLVQLIIDNARNELLPGAYAEVHFQLQAPTSAGAAPAVLKIPANALLFRADGLRVATVGEGGKVVLKSIKVGRDFGTEIEIASGLAADDKVILAPPDSITDGTPVRIAEAENPPPEQKKPEEKKS